MTEGKKYADVDLPIEVIGRRLACENTKFFVYFDHVVDKSGSEVQDYLVVAPKNAEENLVTSVAILPVLGEQIGLIRICRPAIRDYSWEIPHGFIDEGEIDNSSALRELLEETGLAVESDDFSSLGYITPDAGVLAATVHVFLAEACFASKRIQPELGLRDFRFFSFTEFGEMIERSEVQDTFTLAAWCSISCYKMVSEPVINKTMARPAVFLDRDGTLNMGKGYVHRIEDWEWIPGAINFLVAIRQAGFLVIVVTNQAGIARGYYQEDEVNKLHEKINQQLQQYGGWIDGFYHCPHHPESGAACECRKPKPRLIHLACNDFSIDLSRSGLLVARSAIFRQAVLSGLNQS